MAVINGINYSVGDSFICAKAVTGNANEAGTGGTAVALTVGSTYYLRQVDTTYNVYPYLISSSKSGSNYIGWYKADVFPLGTYRISYNANGGTGAPADQTKTYGVSLTLSSTTPTRADSISSSSTVNLDANGGNCDVTQLTANNTISYQFNYWLAEDGSDYDPGGLYTKNESTTLTAQWTMSSSTGSVILPSASKYGHTLKGWSKSSTATSASYPVGSSYTPTDSSVTLYAVWEANTYTIHYDANGGTGAPADQIKTHGIDLTLSSVTPTKANETADTYTIKFDGNGGTCTTTSYTVVKFLVYTFRYWTVESAGTKYNSGASYTINADATLVAQWLRSNSINAVVLPAAELNGYRFLGWSTSPTATTSTYFAGDKYTPSSNITLYAVWEAQGLVYIDNGISFDAYQVFIDNGTSWDQYIPYIDNGSSWDMYS